jgi:ABC-type amino acid transport substrate-binding protein
MAVRLLLTVVLLLFTGTSIHAEETLRFATEGAYPPFNYLDEEGELAGFDVDTAKALCKSMNVRCLLTHRPWEELIPGLILGEYDAVIACMARTPDREQQIDFTGHYFRSKTGFIGLASTAVILSPEGLRGKILASQKGTAQGALLLERYNRSKVKLYPTMTEAYRAMAGGEVELVLTPMLAALEFLKSDIGQRYDFVGDALQQEEYAFTPAHIAVRKGNHLLRKRLDDALHDIRINGSYDRINRKYFPFSIY